MRYSKDISRHWRNHMFIWLYFVFFNWLFEYFSSKNLFRSVATKKKRKEKIYAAKLDKKLPGFIKISLPSSYHVFMPRPFFIIWSAYVCTVQYENACISAYTQSTISNAEWAHLLQRLPASFKTNLVLMYMPCLSMPHNSNSKTTTTQ